MILQFNTCQRRRCTSFRVVTELFIFTLERTPGLDDRIDLAPTMGRVMRTDDGGKSTLLKYCVYTLLNDAVLIPVLVTVGFLNCTRSGGISEVVIDCTDTQLPTAVQCSFNRGPQHPCNLTHISSASTYIHSVLLFIGSLPLVVSNDVSPPGNHSVRIIASTGGETTVSYTITTATSTGEVV